MRLTTSIVFKLCLPILQLYLQNFGLILADLCVYFLTFIVTTKDNADLVGIQSMLVIS